MTHTDVIIDFKKEGLINPPKMEGWPDGWSEYAEPLTHGRGSRTTRRFFKDTSGFEFIIDEGMSFNILTKKGFTLTMWCQYITPEGCMLFAEVPMADQDWYESTGGDVVVLDNLHNIPLDGELIALLREEDRDRGMPGALFDMYGCWFTMTCVKDEDQAFGIADLMSKRSSKKDQK